VPDANAGEAYGRLIVDQVNQERERKTSLESRGITVITTSSALATLLFALTAGLKSASKFKLPESARLPLVLTLGAFILAASFGLIVNIPLKYQEPTARGLGRLRNRVYWDAPAVIGQLRVVEAQIASLEAARTANRLKVGFLLSAIAFELLAVIFLAWAIDLIIYNA
jgi:hypothetical protein